LILLSKQDFIKISVDMNSTLNYIGSKKSLLDFIDSVISKINKDINIETRNIKFFDGFAGTGVVSKYFNRKYGYKTYSNDLEYYSYLISYSNLKVEYTIKLEKIIEDLNKLKYTKNQNYNLITENYSPQGNEKRMFWTIENANKADAISEAIDKLDISEDERIFLKSSLITSLDKVANTASVYEAYFKKSSSVVFELKPIHRDEKIENQDVNGIYNKDIMSDILSNEWDIVYLDPPYNNRQYGSNYGLLNYIGKYDKTIDIYGKAGLIKNYNKSKFSSKVFAENEFKNLIDKIKSKYILISYNNEGIIKQNSFIEILKSKGSVVLYKKSYKNFKSSKNQNDENVYEYLYMCTVDDENSFKEEYI
jgi:adenine-specific DNA-methyltransferase